MKELWLPVYGLEDRYMVSESGLVWSKVVNRLLKPFLNGYSQHLALGLSDGKSRAKTVKVHHLVAEAFISLRPEGLLCLHRDDNKSNNHYSNLYWGTHKQNASDRDRNGLQDRMRGSRSSLAKLTESDVLAIRASSKSYRLLGEEFGVHYVHIGSIKRRERWAHLP